MRLLLDTHVIIGMIDRDNARFAAPINWLAEQREALIHLRVASLWEMSIKSRIGKLRLPIDLQDLPKLATRLNIHILVITPDHVLTPLASEPMTRDPFDRLLLAQCTIEKLELVTVDHALIAHPLAARFP